MPYRALGQSFGSSAANLLRYHSYRLLYLLFYDDRSAGIPATYWFRASFNLGFEVRPQFDHRLVMGAAHRLRVDIEKAGDLGHVHFAVVQHRQYLALTWRQQGVRQLELRGRNYRVDRQLSFGNRIDRHRIR